MFAYSQKYEVRNGRKYYAVPRSIYSDEKKVTDDAEYNIWYKTGVDATRYLPKEHSLLANVDYTELIQQAINKNKIVIMPNFPVLINEKGLVLQNNSTILFQENSEVHMKPNSK